MHLSLLYFSTSQAINGRYFKLIMGVSIEKNAGKTAPLIRKEFSNVVEKDFVQTLYNL